ncbi:flagellar hook assembly protein FlgD [Acuticoccus yangtzensis]|uniref:flagellar hook assembly protein FlgD n=1 Tax=Acuticoccus yangtzensis TaxID=1443441 RepID=UPI00094994C2|nr:flagellar hook assembly protein FlgD [Acuticoccus yangtzensis]
MSVSPISAVGTNTANQTSALQPSGPSSLDYDAFLQLLVTQMQNQDPLNPMNDTEYVAQLATFSNVEQNIITNENLQAMLTAQSLGDAGSLIGRTVTSGDGTSGVVTEVQITSQGNIAILDNGAVITLGQGMTIR